MTWSSGAWPPACRCSARSPAPTGGGGAIETADEWLCLIKTTAARFDALAAHIETNHGYETPELTAVPVDHGSTAYLAWVSSATANP